MISQRLRGVREDGEAIEEAGFMPKLKSMFSEVGINIEDSNGELRSTYAILNDLSGVWDKLSSKQKQYFGEKVAGNRQVKTLNAIMQNWDVVADTIDKANEAQGAALEGNEMYMESIQGKITQLKSAFQELATTTINSDFVKVFVDAGTAIVKFVTNAGGLVPILTTILGLVVAFKGANIVSGIKAIGSAITSLITGLGSATTITTGWIGALIALAGIIATVVSATSNAAKSFSDFQQETTNSKQVLSEEKTKLESLNEELENTNKLIDELNNKGNITISEKSDLKKLQERNTELEREIALQKTLVEIQERSARNAAVEEYGAYNSSVLGSKDASWDNYKYASENLVVGTTNQGLIDYAKENILELKKKAIEINTEYNNIPMELVETFSEEGHNYLPELQKTKEKANKEYEEARLIVADRLSYIDNLIGGMSKIEKPVTREDEIFNSLFNEREELKNLLLNTDAFGGTTADIIEIVAGKYTDAIGEIKETIKETGDFSVDDLGKPQFEEMISELEKFGVSAKDVAQYYKESFSDLNISGSTLTTSVDDVIGNMFQNTEFYSKKFSKMISEIEKTGSLSSGSVKDLLDQYPDVANYLQLTANGYTMTTEALHNFIEAQNEETKQNAVKGIMERQIEIEKLQKQIKELEDTQKDLSEEEQKQIDDNNDIIKGYENEISQLKAVWLEANSAADALERYRTASKTANQDAEHTEGQGILKNLQEAWKSGKVGTDDFKAGMDFFLGENWEATFEGDLEKAYQAASKIGEKYFGKDDQKNAENFRKALVDKGFATLDQKTGTLTMVKGSLTEIAEAFGISEAAAESLFGLLNSYSYGDQITFDKEITSAEELEAAIKSAEEAEKEYKKQKEELAKYKEEHPEDTEGIKEREKALADSQKVAEEAKNAADMASKAIEGMTIEEAITEIDKLKEAIATLETEGIKIPVELTSQYEKAQEFINTLLANEEPSFTITVDSIQDAQDKLNAIKAAWEYIQKNPTISPVIKANVGGVATSAIAALNELIEKLGSGGENKGKKYIVTVDSNGNAKTELAEIQGKRDNLNENGAEVNVKADKDDQSFTDAESAIKKTQKKADEGATVETKAESDGTSFHEASQAISSLGDEAQNIPDAIIGTSVDETKKAMTEKELDDLVNEERVAYIKTEVLNKAQNKASKGDYENIGSVLLKNLAVVKNMFDSAMNNPQWASVLLNSIKTMNTSEMTPEGKEVYERYVKEWEKQLQEQFKDANPIEIPVKPKYERDKNKITDEDIEDLGKYAEEVYSGAASTGVDNTKEGLEAANKVADAYQKIIEAWYKLKQANPEVAGQVEDATNIFQDATQEFFNEITSLNNLIKEANGSFGFNPSEFVQNIISKLKELYGIEFEVDPVIQEDSLSDTLEQNENVQIGAELTLDKSVEDIQKEEQSEAKNSPIEIPVELEIDDEDISVFNEFLNKASEVGVLNEDGGSEAFDGYIDALNSLIQAKEKYNSVDLEDEAKVDEASNGLVDASKNFMTAYKTLSAKINSIQTVKVTADTQSAITKIEQLADTKVTVNVEANITKPGQVNKNTNLIEGFTDAVGTKFAKRGLALVDDGNGPELIEHKKDGTYELGTGDGPRLTKLDSGDVVHTAEETKKITSRLGKVGSFFRDGLNKTRSIIGKAFAGGNFFGNTLSNVSNLLKTVETIKKLSGITVNGSANNSAKGSSSGNKNGKNSSNANNTVKTEKDDLKELESYSKQLFDWIEIKLDKINQKTQDYIKNAKDAIKLTSKNSKLDKSIKQTKKEIEANKKAEKKYQNQANEIANIAGLDKGITSKIKNGTLEISKYDDSTQKKIQEYQKWYEKAQACKKAVKELTDQEKELAKQKLDNISDYYSNKLEDAERARNRVTAERELKEAQGKQETTKTYDSEIKNINTSIKIANKEKSKLEKELKSLTKKGLVKKGDETYREYRNKIADLEIDVVNKKREKIEAQDAKKQVRLTKSEYRASAISNRIDRKNEDKEIKELQGTFGYTAQKKYLTDNLKLLNNQNKEYDTQLKLLKEQQKGLDPLSKKYQDIEKSIWQVESAQKANTKAVIEYKNEINRIDIEKLQDKYDAINTKKSNDNYNINYKNKAGKELSSYDYSTLIKDNSAQIKIDTQMANRVQDEMDKMIAEGTKGIKGKKKNKKISEIKSSKAYKDLQKEYNNYISDSQNLILENIDLNKQRKELPAQKLQYKIDNRNRKANAIRNNIDQGTASGQLSLVDVASGEAGQNKLIAIEEKNIKNYQKQKQIYKDMQKDMDVLSPEYQELADKIEALDETERNSIATQQNLKDEMKDAGLTLLKDDYDKMTDSVDALNDEISIKLAKGLEITKDSYKGLMNVGEGQIRNLENQKQYYEQLMVGMDQSSSKYLEYAATVRSLDSDIRDITESMVNWQNEMDNIDLTKLQWSGDELNAEENRLQNAIKEKNAKGKAINRSDYENLKKNGDYRIQNLKEQNEYLKKQQEGMEKNSKAWQDLQRQIENNESSISDIIVDQEEWTNAQNLIEDKALEHSYNQAQNKVSELQDKIKYEDLTGKAIEEGRYKELINYGEDQLEILKSRKAIQQNLLNGLDKESDRYKEIEATINQIGEEERNISSSIAQWTKDLKNVSIDRMKTDYAQASYLTDQYNFNIQYKKESGQAIESEDYTNIELSNRIEILHLQDQNAALQRLRDQTEEYSKDYIEYQNLINENTDKINNAELESLRSEESRKSMLLDNIKEVISRKEDSKEMIEKSIDYKNVVGKEVTSKDYESLLAEEKSRSGQLNYLKTEYEILKQLLIMRNGESAKESEKYLSYEAEIRDLEKQLKDSEIMQEKYKKDIQNVRIQRFLDDYNSYVERETKIQGEIDLKKSNGSSVTEGDYQSLINVQLAEISYLTLLNKEYNKQKENMDIYSDAYRELTNKIASNNEAINKYKISMQELYDEQKKIKINKLEFDLSDLEDSAKRMNDYLSIREKSGQEVYEEYYKRLIDNGNRQIENLQKQKDAYIELQASTNSMYSDKYREYEKAIWDIDSSIRSLTETIIDYKKELYTIKLDKLEWQLNALAEEADKVNDIMSLHEAQRIDETSKSYEKLISNGMERIKILEETNKILKDQQSSMDFNSEEYQNIENQIRSNLSAINSIKVSQEQWNDSILDLDIQKLQKYKDALSKNNDQYKKQKELEEAIYNLEKARNQKTVRTYRENVGFVYEAKEESVKEATKSLEDVVQNQLLGRIDDLIDALESSKEDTNVYDENGNLIGTRYMTPQLGNLSNVLSNYLSKKNALIDIAGLKDSLNKDLVKTGGTITNAQQNMSLDIGSIIVNEANDGNELAKAIVGQFPNALLQALYKK